MRRRPSWRWRHEARIATSSGRRRRRLRRPAGGARPAPRTVDVTLVDRQNFMLFQPLVYQVATGALSPAEIATPLRAILRRQRNARVVLGRGRRASTSRGARCCSTACRTASGPTLALRHADRRRRFALLLLRPRRVAAARAGAEVAGRRARHPQPHPRGFEAAELEPDPERRRSWLTLWSSAPGRPASRWPARSRSWRTMCCGATSAGRHGAARGCCWSRPPTAC